MYQPAPDRQQTRLGIMPGILITRPLIGAVTITDYDAAGRPGRIVDMNQRATELSYDGKGRLTALFTPADNGLTSNTYNLAGQLETTIDPDDVQRFFDYDPASGRLFTIRNAAGDYIAHNYDSQGNLIETTTYDAGGNRGARQRWNYQHPDLPGRLWKKINGNDSFVAYGYDAAGNVASMTDAEGHPTIYQYDALHRLTQSTQPGSTITSYTYDSQGNPRSMTDPESKTTFFTYDDMGRLVTNDAPDTGLTSYVYDEAGNLVYKTDANDITVEYTYDLLNRLQEIRYPNAAQNVSFSYDQGADGMGRRTGMVDQSGSTIFNYDSRGRLTGKTSVVNNASFTISRAFTPGNRLRQMILPTGRSLDFALDTLGRISTVSMSRNNLVTTLLADLAYRPFGGPSGLRNSAGGVVDNEYGECGCGVTVANPGTFLEQVYTYDNNKNLKSIAATNTPWYNQTFAYDALNRLTAASGAYGSFGYTYDKTGNRQTETKNGQQDTYSYEPGTSGLAAISGQTPVAFTSYADGAIASKGDQTFLYDQESRLIKVLKNGATVADYLYNALNQRVSKKVAATTTLFLYDFDGNLIAEAGDNGAITAEYLYMGTNRLAMVDTASGKMYTYLNDRLGTPRLMTDATNTVIWEATYKPFGEATVNPKSSVVSNFRFVGQYYDAETGLHYNWNRYYDPETGRYITPDPIGLAGGMNLFVYVQGNPVNSIDPMGLAEYYGNWGGPNWTGRYKKSWEQLTPEQQARALTDRLRKPQDKQDECYMRHDICYGNSRTKCANDPCPSECEKNSFNKCDDELSSCLIGCGIMPIVADEIRRDIAIPTFVIQPAYRNRGFSGNSLENQSYYQFRINF